MKIQVGGLAEGIHEFQFEAEPGELDLGENFSHNVLVKAVLDKSVHQISLRGTIETIGSFQCDRCVQEFSLPTRASYRMFYVQDGTEQGDIDPSELQVIPVGTNSIDLSEDIRQVVLLEVPMKLLCSSDCKGICPECGKDRNFNVCSCSTEIIDHRWESLQRLKQNEN